MRRWPLLLGLPLLMGATQINVDLDTTPFYCEFRVSEGAVGVAQGVDNASCITPGATVTSLGLLSTVAGGANFFVPANQRLVLREWGVLVVNSALVATEDCNLLLQTDTTTAGAGSTVSTITTGPTAAAEAECVGGALVVDAIGESCTVNNFTAVIPGGGFWRVRWDTSGAGTCTAWDGGMVWVRGLLQPL